MQGVKDYRTQGAKDCRSKAQGRKKLMSTGAKEPRILDKQDPQEAKSAKRGYRKTKVLKPGAN